jgi:hypothetical protein
MLFKAHADAGYDLFAETFIQIIVHVFVSYRSRDCEHVKLNNLSQLQTKQLNTCATKNICLNRFTFPGHTIA